MRVIVPHTAAGLSDETTAAVLELAPEAEFMPLDDDEAYWRLLSGLWAAREDFTVIEQDIVPHSAVFPEFAGCQGSWCTFAYPYSVAGIYHGSGCVRFRSHLMTEVPDLFERVGEMSNHLHPPRHWCTLDAWTQHVLQSRGHRSCQHNPPVGHADPLCSHGCLTAP